MSSGQINTQDALSGVSSGIGALSSILAAENRAEQIEFEAEQRKKDLKLQSKVERRQAQQKQEQINERLEDVLAQQRVARSASGVAIGSGSPRTDEQEAMEQAGEAQQRVADNLALQQITRRGQMSMAELQGETGADVARSRGYQSALQGLSQFGMNLSSNLNQRQEYDEDTGGSSDYENTDDQPSSDYENTDDQPSSYEPYRYPENINKYRGYQ